MYQALKAADPEIFSLCEKETRRQAEGLELIASENFVSDAVLEAAGTTLTNKYAEGYPGRRYYGGCQYHDEVERLAIDRAKKIFGADHANVQPHSGASANFAVLHGLLKPGETFLAMSLDHGGHLTHGSPVNFSGRLYNAVGYGVREDDQTIDMDEVARLAEEHKPKMILAGASAYPRTLDFERFAEIAKSIGAKFVVDMAHIAGLVAAGAHPSPIPHADIVTTTTHKTLRGPRGGLILCKEEHKKLVDGRVFPGSQGGPLMHVIAAKAVAFGEALRPEFATYQKKIVTNAHVLAEALLANGLELVSGGTDNHLMLIDTRSKAITGKVAEAALGVADITVNKNKIPYDPESPFVTSGVRVGTPAVTTRGMGEAEMKKIGAFIARVLSAPEDEAELAKVRAEVHAMTSTFSLYQNHLDAFASAGS